MHLLILDERLVGPFVTVKINTVNNDTTKVPNEYDKLIINKIHKSNWIYCYASYC